MKNFRGTKNLKNILKELKSNVGIFRGTIYLFNPLYNNLTFFNYFDYMYYFKKL